MLPGSHIFVLLVDSGDISLLESRDCAEALSRADVALCPADSFFIVKLVFDDLSVVHGEARRIVDGLVVTSVDVPLNQSA